MAMNKYILFFLVFLYSCNNLNDYNKAVREKKQLQQTADSLSRKLDSIQKELNSTRGIKYVFCVIKVKSPKYYEEAVEGRTKAGYIDWREKIYISDIMDIIDLNEEGKYRLLDNFEKTVRNSTPES